MPSSLKSVLTVVLGLVLGASVCAAALGGGVAVTMANSYAVTAPPDPTDLPARAFIPSTQPGVTTVAIALGTSGTVVSDALGPFEVFARSDRFQVYTVAENRVPVALSGGLSTMPDYSLADIADGVAPRPDIVVVSAITDPTGESEKPLREWIAGADRHGTLILGVCAGASVLGAAGVLEGKAATTHWADLGALADTYRSTEWIPGERYIQDGNITTTAGVTSGIVGALRLVEQIAGPAEAERIGTAIAYPGWSITADTAIARNTLELADYPYALNVALPWLQPTYAIGVTSGVDEIDLAAAFEVYSGSSFATRTIAVAQFGTTTTAHGLTVFTTPTSALPDGADRLIIPGRPSPGATASLLEWADGLRIPLFLPSTAPGSESAYDPMLADLARAAGNPTAHSTAKFIEYPEITAREAPSVGWRPVALAAAVLALAVAVGLTPLWWSLVRRRRGREAVRRA